MGGDGGRFCFRHGSRIVSQPTDLTGGVAMTIKAHLAELERQHKALELEIAEAFPHTATDNLKIAELKRRKLILKDEIERVRHDHAL